MSQIELSIPHDLSKDEASRRVENLIPDVTERYGNMIKNIKESRDGDIWRFEFDFSKFPFSGHISGEMTVGDSQIALKVDIPDTLAPFKGFLEEAILRKGKELLA
jgi:hypothetical protein